jgi:N,N'-diacetylchitobiose transport system permease protein
MAFTTRSVDAVTTSGGGPEPAAPPTGRRPILPYLLAGPAAVVLIAVMGYPVVRLVILSAQNFNTRSLFTGDAPFVALHNYTDVLTDSTFWQVLLRTAVVTAIVIVALMVIGFALAQLLLRVHTWARIVLSSVLVLVWAMPMVSAALVWQWLFQPRYGVMNWILTQFQIFGDLRSHNWFATANQALALIILLIVWKGLPFVVLTLFASLGQIPTSLTEAAGLDGASGLQTFRHVTVPIMRPVIGTLIILEVIWSVNSFTPFWVLTQGGPDGGTTTLGVYSYIQAFTRNDYGHGSAIAVITVLLLTVFSVFHVRRSLRQAENA